MTSWWKIGDDELMGCQMMTNYVRENINSLRIIMLLFTLSFLLGNFFLQSFALLPQTQLIIIIILSCLFLTLILKKFYKYSIIPLGFILGFLWTLWYAHSILSWTLPKNLEGKPLQVRGTIISIPIKTKFGEQFEFKTKETKLRILWRDPKRILKVGQKYKLNVKLKRIHATQNPGAFDFEGWALQKGIRATGYVIESSTNNFLEHKWYVSPLDQLRQKIQEKLLTTIPTSSTSHWLITLILGERDQVSAKEWAVLRATGTNHLMAIGGLHIGILAGFVYFIISSLWRYIPLLPLYCPAKEVGLIAGLTSALIYSALAGFSIPTQRASIMLIIFILTALSRKKMMSWDVWSLALLTVLIINPLSIITESLWLSFGTIALIIYGMNGRLAKTGLWWKWGRVQWVIGIGLIPLTVLMFQEFSLVSFIANNIAIPWLEFFILPFCLLSCLCLWALPSIAYYLLFIADKSLSLLWSILTLFSHYPTLTQHAAMPNGLILCVTFIGIIILLLPNGVPGKILGIIWLLPFLYYKPALLAEGTYQVNLLDVGQGLSVHIQTRNHNLIFDAGPKLSDSFDAGEHIVIPYLRTKKINIIDMLVISHGDNDHIGGAYAILNELFTHEIKTSVPYKFLHRTNTPTSHCLAGQSWQWDKVNFTFLSPFKDTLNQGNNSSCVLKIDNGYKSILITGDIEKNAEKKLLTINSILKSDILIAPHHGSKTSGVNEFILSVHPTYVLYATGYRNRYHFPHPSIVANYNEIAAIQINTVDTGMVNIDINPLHPLKPIFYRIKNRRYWMD